MHENTLDFTRFFRSLSALNPLASTAENFANWQQSPFFPVALGDETQVQNAKTWLLQWQQLWAGHQTDVLSWRTQLERINPAFVLRNHLLQHSIEQAQCGDFSEVNRLFQALSNPFDANKIPAEFMAQPPGWAKSLMLSCSS